MKMKRTNFYYPQPMLDALKKRSDESGVPVSEIIRHAVSIHICSGKQIETKQKQRRKTKFSWIENKQVCAGTFDTLDEAVQARKMAMIGM